MTQPGTSSNKVFLYFVIGIAVVGLLITAWALLRPHKTGVVVSVGHIGSATLQSGVGKNRNIHKGYSATVKVRVKDTGEIAKVYYRVGRAESIPSVGDEIEFAEYMLTGNGPYPETWAVKLGIIMMGLDALVYVGYLAATWRRRSARGRSDDGRQGET